MSTSHIETSEIEGLKQSDRLVFHNIFHQYFQPLYLFATRFVDEDQAKDIVQDCFFQLWERRKKIKITSSLSAYLFTIVKNSCYKQLKSNRRKLQSTEDIHFDLKQKELRFFIYSEQSILEFDVNDRIDAVISRLPQKCCEVFKDSRYDGLSYKEIAVKHKISIKAVEKHISKALKLFREEFHDILVTVAILLVLYC